MHDDITIEDIEELRLGAGIEDSRLAEAIRGLDAGDRVRLTFLPRGGAAGETLEVRITSRKGSTFRGTLAGRPRTVGLAGLRPGARLRFSAAQIHSILTPHP